MDFCGVACLVTILVVSGGLIIGVFFLISRKKRAQTDEFLPVLAPPAPVFAGGSVVNLSPSVNFAGSMRSVHSIPSSRAMRSSHSIISSRSPRSATRFRSY